MLTNYATTFVTEAAINAHPDWQWLLSVPVHVRQHAIEDLKRAFKANWTKLDKDPNFQVYHQVSIQETFRA